MASASNSPPECVAFIDNNGGSSAVTSSSPERTTSPIPSSSLNTSSITLTEERPQQGQELLEGLNTEVCESVCDLKFVLKGKEVVATKHKDAICKMSRFVQLGLEEQQQEMNEGMTCILRFPDLDRNNFNLLDEFLSSEPAVLPARINLDECITLLDATNSCRIEPLRIQLIEKIKKLIRDDRVFKVLAVARRLEEQELYDFAVSIICQKPAKFCETHQFVNLGVSDVITILENDYLQVLSEEMVYKYCYQWAEEQVRITRGNGLNEEYQNTSYFFRHVMKCVRFGSLALSADSLDYINQYELDAKTTNLLSVITESVRKGATHAAPLLDRLEIKVGPRLYHPDLLEKEGTPVDESHSPVLTMAHLLDNERPDSSDGSAISGCHTLDENLQLVTPDEQMEVATESANMMEGLFVDVDVMDMDKSFDTSIHPNSPAHPNSDKQPQSEKPISPPASLTEMFRRMETSCLSSVESMEGNTGSSTNAEHLATSVTPFPVDNIPSSPEVPDNSSSCSSTDQSDLFTRIRVAKNSKQHYSDYGKLVRTSFRPKKKSAGIIYDMVKFQGFKIELIENIYGVSENTEIIVDGTCTGMKGEEASEESRYQSILNFIKNLNLLSLLVFKPPSCKLDNLTETDIWRLNMDTFLRLNGIVFLKIAHEQKEVVTNYLRNSADILSGCDDARSIAVSNCEFDLNFLDSLNHCPNLKKLNLYRVWGDFGLHRIFKKFSELKELRVWKWKPRRNDTSYPSYFKSVTLSLCDSHFPFMTLGTLMLFEATIIYNDFSNLQTTNIQVLKLECCKILDDTMTMCRVFPKVFPRLEQLMIIGFEELEGESESLNDVLSAHTIVGAAQISSLESLRCRRLKWNYTANPCECETELKKFFEEVEAGECSDFLMTRKDGPRDALPWNKTWTVESYEVMMENQDEYDEFNDALEFTDWRLDMFYKDVSAFQCNFVNNQFDSIKFPKPRASYFY